MTPDQRTDQLRAKWIKDNKATWRVYVLAGFFALIALPAERWMPGVPRPIGAATAAVAAATIVKRRYWAFWWFWTSLAILTILQVPLMIVLKPAIDQLKFFFMWALAIVDLFAISLVIEVAAERFSSKTHPRE